MANQTLFRGPLVNAGSLLNATTQGEVVTPFDGPLISYQGQSIPDVRQPPLAKDTLIPGAVPSFYASPLLITYDGIPQAIASNQISTNAVFTVAVLRNLNTTTGSSALADNAQQITYGVPIIPQGTTQVVNVQAIDFGFATGTTTAKEERRSRQAEAVTRSGRRGTALSGRRPFDAGGGAGHYGLSEERHDWLVPLELP